MILTIKSFPVLTPRSSDFCLIYFVFLFAGILPFSSAFPENNWFEIISCFLTPCASATVDIGFDLAGLRSQTTDVVIAGVITHDENNIQFLHSRRSSKAQTPD